MRNPINNTQIYFKENFAVGFGVVGRIFEVTEHTLVPIHLNLYVCLSGVDVCWWRWVIHCPLAAVSPSNLARIL